MNPHSPPANALPYRGGFSLIELLLTMAIIGTLSSLLFPAVKSAMAKAESVKCLGNLRQIGIAVLAAAADLDGHYPSIETDPSNPVYPPEAGIKGITDVLGPYGVTENTVKCPTDLKRDNYHESRGTSYEWRPMLDGESTTAPKIYLRFGGYRRNTNADPADGMPVEPSRVRITTDFKDIHRGRQNRLYADGHVKGY